MAIDIERTQTYYVADSTSCPHSPHPFLPNKSANNSHQTIKTARLLPESTPLTPRFSTPPNRRRVPDRDPGFPKQICQHRWISWDQIYLFTSFSHLTPPIFQDLPNKKHQETTAPVASNRCHCHSADARALRCCRGISPRPSLRRTPGAGLIRGTVFLEATYKKT